ncbi:hypothetical protein AOLI_G00205170 [Acnodon oligacanthus]
MSPLQRAAGPVWAGDGMCKGGLPLTFRDVCCPSLVRQRPPARHPDTPPALPSLSPYLQSQRGKEDGLKTELYLRQARYPESLEHIETCQFGLKPTGSSITTGPPSLSSAAVSPGTPA